MGDAFDSGWVDSKRKLMEKAIADEEWRKEMDESIDLCSSKRPERLVSKLKTMRIEESARGGRTIVVIRQPRGPEGLGFKAARNV